MPAAEDPLTPPGQGGLAQPAARALGHRYIAICDHAKRLKEGRLELQAEAIAALNERVSRLDSLSDELSATLADARDTMADARANKRTWLATTALVNKDYPVVQTIVFMVTISYVFANLLALNFLLHGALDGGGTIFTT